MTGIVLVLVGILLAAAAALFVVFYGGDAYNAGNARAAAATIVNMGDNVQHAADLYRMQEGVEAPDMAALVAQKYLTQPPDPGLLGRPLATWRTMRPVGGGAVDAYVVDGIDEKVCREINRQAGGADPLPENTTMGSGCVDGVVGRYFFARVSGMR